MTNLTSINCPNVTYIDGNAFVRCKSLQETIFGAVSFLGGHAFYQAQTSPHLYFSELTSLNYNTFSGVTKLVSVDFPKLTVMDNAALTGSVATAVFGTVTSVGGTAFLGARLRNLTIVQNSTTNSISSVCTNLYNKGQSGDLESFTFQMYTSGTNAEIQSRAISLSNGTYSNYSLLAPTTTRTLSIKVEGFPDISSLLYNTLFNKLNINGTIYNL
jgi:hypothetical protein